MYIAGIQPGVQYSGDDFIKGKCPRAGTHGQTSNGNVYVLCLVAASQNLTNGQAVTIDGNWAVTVAAAGPTVTAGQSLGVAITSVTASASSYIWVQRYGLASAVSVSGSALPNVILGMGATAGMLTHGVTTASGVIAGIVLTATGAAGFAPALLNFPHFQAD